MDLVGADIAGKAQPSDVFVLYLAGHGKTVDGRYYFIPQDFVVDGELNEKSIGEAVKVKAIAQEQWQRWFASIPARKSVILFDTCDSGTLTGDASETQQLERGAANDRLAQATGRSILTASGGSEEALEGYRGHGLFTYELLEAIAQADGDNNGTVELTELAAYVYGQVAELSLKVFKQRQVPQMKITSNYPLAMRTRILQDETTPVAETRPNYQLAQAAQLQIQPAAGIEVELGRTMDVCRGVATEAEERPGEQVAAIHAMLDGLVVALGVASVGDDAGDEVRHTEAVVDHRVVAVPDQIVGEEGVAAVVEGRHGVVDRLVQRPARRKVGQEPQEENQRPDSLDDKGSRDDEAQDAEKITARRVEKRALQQLAAAEREAAAHQSEQHQREGDDPQPADLKEHESDDLTEDGQIPADVDDGEAGDANRRSRGEQGVH